jgi:hypothetical protein
MKRHVILVPASLSTILASAGCGSSATTRAASQATELLTGTCTLGDDVGGQGYAATGQFEPASALGQTVWAIYGPTSDNDTLQYQVVSGTYLSILSGQGTTVWSSGSAGSPVNGTGDTGPHSSEAAAQSAAQTAYQGQNTNAARTAICQRPKPSTSPSATTATSSRTSAT